MAQKRRRDKTDAELDEDLDDNAVIDEKATRIFTNAIPVNWYKGTLIPDRRKDYHLELRDGKILNAKTFQVQQKGKEALKIGKKGVSFNDCEKTHLRYWNKQPRPIFFVAIDITTQKGYWLFI